MPSLHLVPAYGRDYGSAADVIAAWRNLNDFRIADVSHKDDGRYCNRQDAEREHLPSVQIRYARLTKVIVLYARTSGWGTKPPKRQRGRGHRHTAS